MTGPNNSGPATHPSKNTLYIHCQLSEKHYSKSNFNFQMPAQILQRIGRWISSGPLILAGPRLCFKYLLPHLTSSATCLIRLFVHFSCEYDSKPPISRGRAHLLPKIVWIFFCKPKPPHKKFLKSSSNLLDMLTGI